MYIYSTVHPSETTLDVSGLRFICALRQGYIGGRSFGIAEGLKVVTDGTANTRSDADVCIVHDWWREEGNN